MNSPVQISFGDTVRVKEAPETTRLDLAGRQGSVFGVTTPSVTGVEVIGKLSDDFALNVNFEDCLGEYWFAPELLEFVDHGAGAEITLEGVPKKWTRTEDGEWEETDTKKPWWKIW